MKKVLMITVLAGLSFASCKKDYTCACKGDSNFPAINLEYKDVKKADAEDACKAAETTYKIANSSVTCSI